MLHDLPSDALAAWFYKDAEASVELDLSSTRQMNDNAGESSRFAHVHYTFMHWCNASCV